MPFSPSGSQGGKTVTTPSPTARANWAAFAACSRVIVVGEHLGDRGLHRVADRLRDHAFHGVRDRLVERLGEAVEDAIEPVDLVRQSLFWNRIAANRTSGLPGSTKDSNLLRVRGIRYR